jgi:uncharacterized membrane protein YgcG
MQSKTLLLALSVAAFSSCSTAYKTGQTPDDVYYSPARVAIPDKDRDDDRDHVRNDRRDDYEITMGIRDRRWRDFRDDYEYKNSPYNYTVCNCMCYGYYYNPYYYPWAIYTTKLYTAPVNTTPRMVNLNAYNGYNTKVATGKTNGTVTWSNPSTQYNNSNRSTDRSETRRVLFPRNNNNNSSSSNETRTYTPSSSNNNSSSGSSSSGSSSSGSVSRPGRGG